MDWIKVILYLNLAILHSISVEADNSEKGNATKEEKLISNHKLSNLTSNKEEILEESPSETIRFRNPIVYLENDKKLAIDKKITSEKSNNNQQVGSAKDLTKEANEYMLAFTQTPVVDHWRIVSEIIPYEQQDKFTHPASIIESKSFVYKPIMSSVQTNYSPTRNLEGRTVDSSREYPVDYSSYENQRHPDSKNPPGGGHSVHTETQQDYGRFLPVHYKSKIEQEAEALVKQKKTQSSTITAPNKLQKDNAKNRPKSRGYNHHYIKPVRASFFQKGGFENAYPFSDNFNNQDGQRHPYTSEEYPKQTSTFRPKLFRTTIAIEKPYNTRQPVTSTETYQPHYSYPSEQYSSHSNSHKDSAHESSHPESPVYRDHRDHRGPQHEANHHRDPHHDPLHRRPQHEANHNRDPHHDPLDRRPQHEANHHRDTPHEGSPHRHPQHKANNHRPEYNKDIYHRGKNHPHHRDPHTADDPEREPPQTYTHDREPHKIYANHREPHQTYTHNGDQHHVAVPHHTSHHNVRPHVDSQNNDFFHTGQHHNNVHYKDSLPREYHHTSSPNAPTQYDSSTEKYAPTYSDDFQKPFSSYPDTTPHFHEYTRTEQQLPTYQNDEPHSTIFYEPVTDSPRKEFQMTYSNIPPKPSLPPDSSHYPKHSSLDSSQPNRPLTKNPSDTSGEKTYYNTFKSLVDLYKSFGFQPFNLDDIPILPSRFPYESSFYGKTEVSGPTSSFGSMNDFVPNSKVPIYSHNTNLPRDQKFDNYPEPYSHINYNSKENEPGSSSYHDSHSKSQHNSKEDYQENVHFKYTSSEISKNPQYPEQIPYDTNGSPVVSTEHYDHPESLDPQMFNTQVEAPKEAYLEDQHDFKYNSDSKSTEYIPPEDIKVKGIRIKNYDAKTFFGDSQQTNLGSPPESEFSSSASLSDIPTHSVVRQNPYNVNTPYSDETGATYTPRIYRQKLKVESRPAVADSEERTNNFHSGNITPNGALTEYNENPQSEDNFPKPKKPARPANINHQWRRPHSKRKQKHENGQEYRQKEGNKSTQSSWKTQDELNHSTQKSRPRRTQNSEYPPQKREKQSNQRSHRKRKSSRKSQPDHMEAEGSTYHWGMEKHKGTAGFFQYANVPGAKAFEYGYRMGGPEHTREKHHQTKGIKSKIKVNWEDGNGDSGDHYWEFNHNSNEDDTEKVQAKSEKSQSEDSQE